MMGDGWLSSFHAALVGIMANPANASVQGVVQVNALVQRAKLIADVAAPMVNAEEQKYREAQKAQYEQDREEDLARMRADRP
jgi:hypothetical protein